MSFTAVESLRLLKKAEIEKQKRLDSEIDVDVQTLRELADDLMLNGIMNSKGYYALLIKRSCIKYRDPKVIIRRFVEHMNRLGFTVPDVNKRNAWREKNSSYIIQFRPNDEVLAQMKQIDDVEEERERTESSRQSSSASGSGSGSGYGGKKRMT